MKPFEPPSRAGAQWFSAGLASSFPDLESDDDNNLSELRICNGDLTPGCKVFQVPREADSAMTQLAVAPDDQESFDVGGGLKDQVLILQYKGTFHAIDHKCPHASFPLSQGNPFDIEDFGVILSAGLTCSKHGWSFDLFSGMSDRGKYKLSVWEVQLHETTSTDEADKADNALKSTAREVWVRRKQRIG
ncbi:Rieske domain-containing protein [Exophiala viscosa]|uniref:Rieske domain-containing protein n=1 Tax=Exophiala viscosa TaxID=2486360 RepID=A0AAN6ICQ0_9EURO|nr:Rieske domain-containing protein [Exophiala viscosa]